MGGKYIVDRFIDSILYILFEKTLSVMDASRADNHSTIFRYFQNTRDVFFMQHATHTRPTIPNQATGKIAKPINVHQVVSSCCTVRIEGEIGGGGTKVVTVATA